MWIWSFWTSSIQLSVQVFFIILKEVTISSLLCLKSCQSIIVCWTSNNDRMQTYLRRLACVKMVIFCCIVSPLNDVVLSWLQHWNSKLRITFKAYHKLLVCVFKNVTSNWNWIIQMSGKFAWFEPQRDLTTSLLELHGTNLVNACIKLMAKLLARAVVGKAADIWHCELKRHNTVLDVFYAVHHFCTLCRSL